MNEVLVDLKRYRKEIELRKNNFDFSFGGKTGFCFIEGNYVIKVYDKPIKKKNHTDLSMFKSDRISFPIKYLYKGEYVIGEVLPYYNANTLDNAINLRTNIQFLYDSYCEIRDEIFKFPNIIMYDLWQKNILYSSKKGMFLIDVTDWKCNEKNNLNFNIKYLDASIGFIIRQIVFDDGNVLINIDDFYQILRNNILGKELLHILESYARGDFVFLDLIEAYKEFIRIYYNYDIKTISDMKKYTKIMKYS